MSCESIKRAHFIIDDKNKPIIGCCEFERVVLLECLYKQTNIFNGKMVKMIDTTIKTYNNNINNSWFKIN